MSVMKAHEIFSTLDQEYNAKKWTGNEQLLTRQMRLSDEILAVFAVRKSDGRHILYLQCDPEDAKKKYEYPAWKGISIEYSGFCNLGLEGCYVRIEQGEGSDDEVYFLVSDDICSCLSGIKKSNLRERLYYTLERWKRFFSLRNNIKLTVQEQMGIFGELWLLRCMLQNGISNRMIYCWKGPYHGVFDFSLQNMSIEVKTTASKLPYKVKISNELQLDEQVAGGVLILCFIATQMGEAAGETLDEIIKCIENFVIEDELAYNLFQDKLLECGLVRSYIKNYTTKFLIKEFAFYNVKEGFPRILSKDLPNGVGDISYSVDISACKPYRIKDQEFWDMIKLHAREESYDS